MEDERSESKFFFGGGRFIKITFVFFRVILGSENLLIIIQMMSLLYLD